MTPVWRFLAFQSSDLRPHVLELLARSCWNRDTVGSRPNDSSMLACTCPTFVIFCEAVPSYDRPVVENTSILYVCYTLLHCTRELRRQQKITAYPSPH
ncbi:hypothetical protein V8C43DRAFT_278601 [Trichoderma afarasin]